jgi:hypothetical protein
MTGKCRSALYAYYNMHIMHNIIVFLQRVIGHRKTESFVIVPPLHVLLMSEDTGEYDTFITVVIMSSDMSADSVPVTELIPKGHIYIRSHRKSESEYCNCASCS